MSVDTGRELGYLTEEESGHVAESFEKPQNPQGSRPRDILQAQFHRRDYEARDPVVGGNH